MSEDSCTKKPLALAIGSAFAATLAVAPVANAADNPFGMTELSGGYMQMSPRGWRLWRLGRAVRARMHLAITQDFPWT